MWPIDSIVEKPANGYFLRDLLIFNGLDAGGFAIRRGDTDAGKLSIIGGLIIAGAPVIVKALFTAFGLGGSTVDVGSFQ